MIITFDWLNVVRECVFNAITNNKIIKYGGRSFFGKLHEPGDECQLWMGEPCLQFNAYTRGSQPFGTRVPPNQNCTPLRTPKSDLYPLCVPPTTKFYPNKLHLSRVFYFAYPCGLLTYPLWPLHVPLGVRVPHVENRWPIQLWGERVYMKCTNLEPNLTPVELWRDGVLLWESARTWCRMSGPRGRSCSARPGRSGRGPLPPTGSPFLRKFKKKLFFFENYFWLE